MPKRKSAIRGLIFRIACDIFYKKNGRFSAKGKKNVQKHVQVQD